MSAPVPPSTAAAESPYWSLVAELANNPGAVATLLDEHRPAPDGLCIRCTRGGTGTRHVPSPCPIAAVALLARDRRATVARRMLG